MKYPLIAYCCYEGVCVLYDVLYNDKKVGRIQLEKDGLYYQFSCACTPPGNGIYRLYTYDGNTVIKLGVCIPDGNRFVIRTKIPTKYFFGNPNSFWLESDGVSTIPISNGKTFGRLDKLDTARLSTLNGQQFIIID